MAEPAAVVPAQLVLVRVGLDGLLWGLVGGMVYAVLLSSGASLIEDPGPDGLLWAASVLPAALVVGAIAGGVVGTDFAPVAAGALLVLRPLTDAAPLAATLVTLGYLGGLLVLLVEAAVETTGFVLGVCLLAAWPMHRSLRRSLLPEGRPA